MQKSRFWILLFSAVTFVASVASLYVHYRLITDTSYTSFCDISATVNCETVYQSAYGTVRGVPVAAGGAIWSALVFLLALAGMRSPKSALTAHVAQAYGGLRPGNEPTRGGLAPWQVKRACERLDSDLGGKLSLQQIAAEFDLSVSHFSRAPDWAAAQSAASSFPPTTLCAHSCLNTNMRTASG